MRNNGLVRHTQPEMELKRELFTIWYFDPFKDPPTVREWAVKHQVTYEWCNDQKKSAAFVSQMEEFRKTYREHGDAALQNLLRFALAPEPRVAIPAIKILADVMGYNAPQKLEVTTRGMSLADYLVYVKEHGIPTRPDPQPALKEASIEGEFHEQAEEIDVWETAAV